MLSAITFIDEDEAEKALKEDRKQKKKDKKKAQKVLSIIPLLCWFVEAKCNCAGCHWATVLPTKSI